MVLQLGKKTVNKSNQSFPRSENIQNLTENRYEQKERGCDDQLYGMPTKKKNVDVMVV